MKFIIIHDGKKESEKMADILNASVSQFEDIVTTVWSEKQYMDNKPTLSSDEYLVFLGKTRTGENILSAPSFENHFSQFNMRYGWVGKQAVMGLDSNYKFDKDSIAQFSQLYNETFKIEIEKNKNGFSDFMAKIDKKIKAVPTVGKIAAVIGGGLFLGVFGTVVAVTSGTYLVKGHIDNNKVKEHAKQLLLKKFVDEGLKSFLKIEE